MYITYTGWSSELPYGQHLGWIWPDPFTIHDVPEKGDRWLGKHTLVLVQCHALLVHLSSFSVERHCRTRCSRSSCSCRVVPYTRISLIRQMVPISPLRASCIRRWKCSSANEIPKGNCQKWYRPNGVMNVVSNVESGDNGICQNPELASSFVNSFAPANWASVWLTPGSGCLSHLAHRLSHVRSTQILTRLFDFGTTTILEHHSVGWVTLEITPLLSVLSSSCQTAVRRGIVTPLGVERENGCALSCSSILYSLSNFPNPLKSEGNSLMGDTSSLELTDAILLMIPRPAIVKTSE